MQILAVDTSTAVGSVAVVDGERGRLLAEVSARARDRHGETILKNIERVLELAGVGLDAIGLIAVGIGPGSFTGVRVGLATAKGLALARQLPLVGVTSLRAVARALIVGESGAILVPVIDAHKGEVYVGAYRAHEGALEEMIAPFHAVPGEAAARARAAIGGVRVVIAGDGVRAHATFATALGEPLYVAPELYDAPRAACVALEAAIGGATGASDAASLEPLYLRASDAILPAGVKRD